MMMVMTEEEFSEALRQCYYEGALSVVKAVNQQLDNVVVRGGEFANPVVIDTVRALRDWLATVHLELGFRA